MTPQNTGWATTTNWAKKTDHHGWISTQIADETGPCFRCFEQSIHDCWQPHRRLQARLPAKGTTGQRRGTRLRQQRPAHYETRSNRTHPDHPSQTQQKSRFLKHVLRFPKHLHTAESCRIFKFFWERSWWLASGSTPVSTPDSQLHQEVSHLIRVGFLRWTNPDRHLLGTPPTSARIYVIGHQWKS